MPMIHEDLLKKVKLSKAIGINTAEIFDTATAWKTKLINVPEEDLPDNLRLWNYLDQRDGVVGRVFVAKLA